MSGVRVKVLFAAVVVAAVCLLCTQTAYAVTVDTVASPSDVPREKQISYASSADYGNPSSVSITGNSDLKWGHPSDVNNGWNYLYLDNQYSKGSGTRSVAGQARLTYSKMCKSSDGRLVDMILTISDIKVNRRSDCPSDRLYLLSAWPGSYKLNTHEAAGVYNNTQNSFGVSFKVTTNFYYTGTTTSVDGTFYMQSNDIDAIDFINSTTASPALGDWTESITVTSSCGPTAWVLQNSWLRWYTTPQGLRFYNANMPVNCHDNIACTMICGLKNGSSFYWSGSNCSTWILASIEAKAPDVPKGGGDIQKQDSETGLTPQGDATFAGIRFQVTYVGEELELEDGSILEPGTVMANPVTDATGAASIGEVPCGVYEVREVSVGSSGYLLSAPIQTVTIGEGGTSLIFRDNVQRGSMRAQKIDADLTIDNANMHDIDLDWPGPQGNATLTGAQFGIYNVSANPVKVNGTLWPSVKGQNLALATPLATLTTDANGKISLSARVLPYGTYVIRELKAPQGYLVNKTFAQGVTFTIRADGMWYIYDGKGDFIGYPTGWEHPNVAGGNTH